MTDIVQDIAGTIPKEGDIVAFAPAQRGAQEWRIGVIKKVNKKSVTITRKDIRRWGDKMIEGEELTQRNSRCFVILTQKEEK